MKISRALQKVLQNMDLMLPLGLYSSIVIYILLAKKLSIWADEGCSIVFSHPSISDLFRVMADGESNMALYYVVLHYWMKLSTKEELLRILSAVFSFGSIIILYFLSTKLFEKRTARHATLILSCNVTFVYYALEIRAYSLFILLSITTVYLFLWVKNEGFRETVWFTIAVILTTYVHVFGLFLYIALFLFWFLSCVKKPECRGKIILSCCLYSLGCLPVLLISSGGTAWAERPGVEDLYRVFSDFLGGKYALALVFVAFAVGVGSIRGSNRSHGDDEKRIASGLLLCASIVLVPIVLVFVLSQFKPVFMSRYFLFSLPFLILIVAWLLAKIQWRVVSVSILLILMLVNLWLTLRTPERIVEDWKKASAFVLEQMEPEDGLLFFPKATAFSFSYYAARKNFEPNYISGSVEPQHIFSSSTEVRRDLEKSFGRYRRIWLISSHAGKPERARALDRIRETISGRHDLHPVAPVRFKGVDVELYGSRSASD